MIDRVKYPEATISDEEYSVISTTFDNHIVEGLPIFDPKDWKDINSKYDKETIRQALIIYIIENECPFPYKNIVHGEVVRLFNRLREKSPFDFIKKVEEKKIGTIESRALCKYEDDMELFTKDGEYIINSRHQYNRGSDFFQQENRYACGTWAKKAPIDAWKDWKGLKSILGPLWRMDKSKLNKDKYISGIRLGLYNATQFKPPVAKTMYDLFNCDVVFDISCGWGDRLFGFYVSNASEYYGCDPNPDTYEKYKEQCKVYQKILGDDYEMIEGDDNFTVIGKEKKVRIWNLPAEDLDYSLLPELDMVFSSPPYFATEKYAEDNKETQSWFRYEAHDSWQNDFLYNVMDKCWTRLKDDGIMAINIIDGSIKGERQDICKQMIDKYKGQYRTQMGMVMSQRPNAVLQRYVDKIEGESNEEYTARVAVFEKEVTGELPYIEPIYLFSNKEIKIREQRQSIEDLFE